MHLRCQVTGEGVAKFRFLVGHGLELCFNVKHLSNMFPNSNYVSLSVPHCQHFGSWLGLGFPAIVLGMLFAPSPCPHKETLHRFSHSFQSANQTKGNTCHINTNVNVFFYKQS
jgi:hypothetical protein